MANPFITETSFTSPSLNRVRVMMLPPGGQFAAQLCGLSGYDLLSSKALQALIAKHQSQLGLKTTGILMLLEFNDCFSNPSAAVRQTARGIAQEFGRRLALLLSTLKQAVPENRRARPSWKQNHWEYWQQVTKVYVGGGLVAGPMGPLAIESARKTLLMSHCVDLDVKLAPFASNLPLAGLARTASSDAQAMLVLDFGQTNIKRAVADFRSESGCKLIPLTSVPTPIGADPPPELTTQYAQELADFITNLSVQSWLEASRQKRPISPIIGLSLACYLISGHPPLSEMGPYGRLQLLCTNLQAYLSHQISTALGKNIIINLHHDGTAAGLVFAGPPHTVALTLGTALGIGFPPSSEQGLRQLCIGIKSRV